MGPDVYDKWIHRHCISTMLHCVRMSIHTYKSIHGDRVVVPMFVEPLL